MVYSISPISYNIGYDFYVAFIMLRYVSSIHTSYFIRDFIMKGYWSLLKVFIIKYSGIKPNNDVKDQYNENIKTLKK